MHTFGRSAPLSPEEVEGWRAWSVVEHDGGYVLSSLTRAEVWEPGVSFDASCSKTRHDAPGRRCACGVYAATDPNELARLGRIAGAAVGQVSLWGRLVEHSRGYRASSAYPTRLRLVCVACLSDGHGEPAAVVERDASGSRTRLRPLCECHANGRPLPVAAPIEAELLGAYRIDVLPDASVRRITRLVARRRRSSRVAVFAAAAARAVALVVGGVTVMRHPAQVATSSVPLPPPGLVAHAGRQDGPVPRTGDGLRTVTHAKLTALSPFPTVHCGAISGSDVTPTLSCADPSSDVFVENFGPAGEHRFGTCGEDTIATTLQGDRILCWRALP